MDVSSSATFFFFVSLQLEIDNYLYVKITLYIYRIKKINLDSAAYDQSTRLASQTGSTGRSEKFLCSNLMASMVKYMYEPYLQTYARREDSDQPAHSHRLIIIFIRRIFDTQGCKISSCGLRGLWSDCAQTQSDLGIRWSHMPESTFLPTLPIFFAHVRNFYLT